MSCVTAKSTIGTPIISNMASTGRIRTICAEMISVRNPIIRNILNRLTDAQAGATPCRSACHPLVASVGRMSPASANSGETREPMPEIMIIGMAKPTMPLTTPATKPINRQPSKAGTGTMSVRNSIPAQYASHPTYATAKYGAQQSVISRPFHAYLLRCACKVDMAV